MDTNVKIKELEEKIEKYELQEMGVYIPNHILNTKTEFSNAIKEGIRSDAAIATNPNTRAGWWFKTAKLQFIPKLLMWAALYGMFGDKLKEMLENVSEYDKTNYLLMHAMGPNVAGVIGSAVAAGILLSFLS